MNRVQNASIAAARQLATAMLAGILVISAAQAQPPKQVSKKKPAAASKRPVVSHRSKSSAPASSHTRHSVSSHNSSGSARVRTRRVIVTRKKIHGRWVRTTQIVRAAPKPSFQTHPNPDRYQQIQQALASAGYFKGQANGDWGGDSVDALKHFQTDHNLPNDGKISALSLIDLGLGPNRDSAASLPPIAAPVKDSPVPVTLSADPPAETAHD
jgi:hypothetical protein